MDDSFVALAVVVSALRRFVERFLPMASRERGPVLLPTAPSPRTSASSSTFSMLGGTRPAKSSGEFVIDDMLSVRGCRVICTAARRGD